MKNSKLHTTEDKSNEKVTSSNSKSEDTPRMIDVHRKQLRAQRWLQDNTHEGMTPEPPQDTSLTEITAEYFMATDPDRVALQRKVLAWHKAERAKLFEQIRSEADKLAIVTLDTEDKTMNVPVGEFVRLDDIKKIISSLLAVS